MRVQFGFLGARAVLLAAVLVVGCGASDATDEGSGLDESGGTTATGSGGTTITGSGGTASGGVSAGTGGVWSEPTGGVGGAATGGTADSGGSGGQTSTGGQAATGGQTATGGQAGTGGGGSQVPLPPSVTALFPAPDATGICVDVPLTITFSTKPSIGTGGKISIYATSNPNTPVDSIDVGAASYTDSVGGTTRNLVRPVFIDGNAAVVYFHEHKLSANTSYFVTISSGTFVDASKTPIGTVTSSSAWTFTTGTAPQASTSMTVDRTGSGPFCTIQGAFDAIPANNTTARTITVEAGTYHEMLYLSAKKNLTLYGTSRTGTVIAYPNNDKLNAGTAGRALFYANGSSGLNIENLTIHNTTPQDGSQAEALYAKADQVILRESNFKSLQDTLQLSGRVYVVDSYLEGNVDFVWGSGPAYFDRSEIKTVGRAGAIVQARNGSSGYGYVFVDSKLTSDAGITNQILARIDVTQYPYSHVAFINCKMTGVAAKGWTITPNGTTQTGNLRFWEYQSTDANGVLLNTNGRATGSKQLNPTEAASMRDKATVLAGWNPQ